METACKKPWGQKKSHAESTVENREIFQILIKVNIDHLAFNLHTESDFFKY
jgi:hypothetical protein